jgi:hypothetical protein
VTPKTNDLLFLSRRVGCVSATAATPASVAQAHVSITGSRFVVLLGCSRMAQAERPDLTLGLVRGWLAA